MKVHQMKALSQLSLFRSPFQGAQQTAVRPGAAEESVSNFRKIASSQLLFDLELEESLESRQSSRPPSAALSKLQQAMLPFSDAHTQLLQEAEQAWRKIATQTRGTGTSALANALRQSGYEAQACMAIGGGSGGAACLQNLCHRFVSCSIQDGAEDIMFVIDPHFREQFEIARPTPSYQGLLALIPDVVVLTEEQCIKLVQLLCHELGECFKQGGEAVPPWRRPASMASKWQPRHSFNGGLASMAAVSSMQSQPHAARLARASAAPIVGELSRELPRSRNSTRRASCDVATLRHLQPSSQAMQPVAADQSERFESIAGTNNMLPDVRRLLAFY